MHCLWPAPNAPLPDTKDTPKGSYNEIMHLNQQKLRFYLYRRRTKAERKTGKSMAEVSEKNHNKLQPAF